MLPYVFICVATVSYGFPGFQIVLSYECLSAWVDLTLCSLLAVIGCSRLGVLRFVVCVCCVSLFGCLCGRPWSVGC